MLNCLTWLSTVGGCASVQNRMDMCVCVHVGTLALNFYLCSQEAISVSFLFSMDIKKFDVIHRLAFPHTDTHVQNTPTQKHTLIHSHRECSHLCMHTIHQHTSLPIPSHTSPSPHTPKASFTTTLTHLFWRSPTRAADKSRSTWVWCTWTSQTGGLREHSGRVPRASCPEPGSPTLTVCGWSDHASAPAACWRKPADVRPLCWWALSLSHRTFHFWGRCPSSDSGTGSPAYRQLSITSGPTISRAGTQALTQGSQCSITSGLSILEQVPHLCLKANEGQLLQDLPLLRQVPLTQSRQGSITSNEKTQQQPQN